MIKPVCNKCNEELNDFGGILLSPPDSDDNVKKHHLCKECYQIIVEGLKTNEKEGKTRKRGAVQERRRTQFS